MTEPMPDLAYYYPAPYWHINEIDRLKSLLLFFDGIAILLPRYMSGRESAADPVLAGPLREMGLLTVLEPETFVDQQVTEALITAVTELITGGAFDGLDHHKQAYHELSRSRMGWGADVELSDMIIEELIARGLARPSEDGVSVPLHPVVRTTFLVLLSQLARAAGRRAGLALHPATSSHRAVEDLVRVLSLPASPSAGHLVTLDLEAVGLDLASVPLDDILEFRGRDPLGTFALGAGGAAWLSAGPLHDPLGGVLALATAGAALAGAATGQEPTSAYSYVFTVRHELGSRTA